MNSNKWYHGTTYDGAMNIQKQGVIASYNHGTSLDFGMGFYLTDTYERAENYISRVPVINPDGTMDERTSWTIVEFEFNPFQLLFEGSGVYTYKNFPKHNYEFAEFSFHNRVFNVFNEEPHGYDIIWGVMSDSVPDQVILKYKNGEITDEEAIKMLMKPNSMKQLYVGNQTICDMLHITNIFNKEGN